MSRSSGRAVLVSAMALVIIGSGCTAVPKTPGTQPIPHGAFTDVYVMNQHWHDISVSLARGRTEFPLGTVGSHGARRLRIRTVWLQGPGELRLIALDRLSRDSYVSVPFSVSPGQRVEWEFRPRHARLAVR